MELGFWITRPGQWLVRIIGVGLAILPGLIPTVACAGATPTYDPLALPVTTSTVRTMDLDASRMDGNKQRQIPLRIYLPPGSKPAPVILFSHGLGGSRAGSPYLGYHWAARGYVAVFVQHPGSDESVWKGVPVLQRMAAMRKAANFSNMIDRLKDVPAVLDNLAQWNADAGHKLRGRLDLERVGMSGHSFGALTTQGVSGMSIPVIGLRYQDSRIRAALPMSPSAPNWVGSASRSFAKVGIPWMLMTGTKDDSPIGNTSPMDRQKVFAALPAGEHYELVLDGADHGAFTEMTGRTRWSTSHNPNHHRVILALSTAFWDAYLMNRPEARQWLRGTGPKGISQPGDVFRIK